MADASEPKRIEVRRSRVRVRVTTSPETAAKWLADRLEVRNSGKPICGPKIAAQLAGVSVRGIQRAYTSGSLVASFPCGRGPGKPVLITVLRLAEWIIRKEREE